MTVEEKVRKLSWFDTMDKVKDILLDILLNVENLWSRIKSLENSTSNLPTYADNAAAIAGGLPVGYLYKTSTGVVMVRF